MAYSSVERTTLAKLCWNHRALFLPALSLRAQLAAGFEESGSVNASVTLEREKAQEMSVGSRGCANLVRRIECFHCPSTSSRSLRQAGSTMQRNFRSVDPVLVMHWTA